MALVTTVSIARQLFESARPQSPSIHLVSTEASRLVLVPNGSQVFEVDEQTFSRLESALGDGDSRTIELFVDELGLGLPELVDGTPPQDPRLHALSLAVA